MIYEIRTYTCRVGLLKPQLALHISKGLPIQIRHLGEPLAFLSAETGNPNQYTHIWQFTSANARVEQRTALMNDPEWSCYLQESMALDALLEQESRIMNPVAGCAYPGKTGKAMISQ